MSRLPRARRFSCWLVVVLAAALAQCASSAPQAAVRIVGTDMLGGDVTRALYEFSNRAEAPLVFAFDGSRPGLAQLKSGKADLALVVLAPDEAGATAGFESVALAYHCVVVLVSAVVPHEQVTLEQLRDIFSRAAQVTSVDGVTLGSAGISRWRDRAAHADGGHGIATEFSVTPCSRSGRSGPPLCAMRRRPK